MLPARSLLKIALPAIVLSAAVGCRYLGTRKKPNVIVIVVDALRADYVGAYGFGAGITPTIDKFAGESVMFAHCASAAPWTKPSVTSLFTSLYPETHGLNYPKMNGDDPDLSDSLPPTVVTMAEAFKRNGYRTAAFNSNPWIEPPSGLMQGFDVYKSTDRLHLPDFLDTWISTFAPGAPLFLYVHLLDVHGHYIFEMADFNTLKSKLSHQPDAGAVFDSSDLVWYMKGTFHDNDMEKSVLNWRAAYAAGVKRFDGVFAKLLAAFQNSGLLENSIVIFTSDHGENLVQHGFLEHGDTLNIEELHVPLLMRFSDGAHAGRRVESWVNLVDLFPTLCELCKLKVTDVTFQGKSIVPEILGGEADRTVFSSAMKTNDEVKSALSGNYHLISMGAGHTSMLFNIADDPGEKKNIAGRTPDLVSHLLADLNGHLQFQKKTKPIEHGSTPMTEEMKEQLRSLGYLQ